MLIQVRHNIEVAHRLSLLEGKCENIHGHSMWVELSLIGHHLNDRGIICDEAGFPFEFSEVKKRFRTYLDTHYDHHLLLNQNDVWAQIAYVDRHERRQLLPGLQTFPGDPSTENLALWIAQWAANEFTCDANVKVQETSVNAAVMGVKYGSSGE
jgi:6-pyruvoyltetrahydropterin/6-carboxytetrahydropterin synthase